MPRRPRQTPQPVDRGRARRVFTTDTRADDRDAEEAARLSGDRARIPMSLAPKAGGYLSSFGGYQLSRLPTADEQARGEWPERDELEE
jgi:hypothetical protein